MHESNNFNQLLNQVTAAQRRLFESLTSYAPGMSDSTGEDMRKNVNDALSFQEKVVNSSLDFQASLAHLALESQKQFWQTYFNLLRGK